MAQMFLRTAMTEQRIEKLERQMSFLIEHFDLEVPSDLVDDARADDRPRIVKSEPIVEPKPAPPKTAVRRRRA